MEKKYFLGIDVGTNESKGALLDEDGRLVVSASTEHGLENPKPNYFEHDADEIWYKDLCILSKRIISDAGIDPEQIKGVGLSALSSDCLPVDIDGKPLRKAILYGIDARAMEECKILTDKWGQDEVLRLFGRPLGSSDIASKILWIKRNEPEIYKKTHKFLTASSYLTYKLTSNYTIDRFLGLASFNPLYGSDGKPDPKYCDGICSPDQLAKILWTTDIAGFVTQEASKDTGLAKGTPVITGGDDSGAEAISCGVMSPGDMLIQMGSTVYMILCTEKFYDDERLWRESFIVPNTYDISAGTNTSGALTKWIRDIYYREELKAEKDGGLNTYRIMMNDMDNVPVGSRGLVVLPYFAGERTPINDEKAKGMIIGLSLNHDRRDIVRAAYEGVCFSIKQHFEIFKSLNVNIKNIMITGGGTKNHLWIQMLSDVLGMELRTPAVTLGASYGDALMAMIGTGHKKDFIHAGKLIKSGKIYRPNFENTEKYEAYYRVYDELYQANKKYMHELDRLIR